MSYVSVYGVDIVKALKVYLADTSADNHGALVEVCCDYVQGDNASTGEPFHTHEEDKLIEAAVKPLGVTLSTAQIDDDEYEWRLIMPEGINDICIPF